MEIITDLAWWDSLLARLPVRNPRVMFKRRGHGNPTTWVTEVVGDRICKRAIGRAEFDRRGGADVRVSVPDGDWLLDLPDTDVSSWPG